MLSRVDEAETVHRQSLGFFCQDIEDLLSQMCNWPKGVLIRQVAKMGRWAAQSFQCLWCFIVPRQVVAAANPPEAILKKAGRCASDDF